MRPFLLFSAVALACGTSAFAQEQKGAPQNPKAGEGTYTGQSTTTTDRTDTEGTLPRTDTTVESPMSPPPAGTVGAGTAETKATATPAQGGNIVAVLKADPQLSTFAELAQQAGFATTFESKGPLTVLAPSNEAFAKLPPAQLESLRKPENVQQLQQVLLYHVIPAAAPSSALKGTSGDVPTARGTDKVKINGTGAAIKVNGATVVRPDVQAANGIVHVIDTVLLAPAAATHAPTQ